MIPKVETKSDKSGALELLVCNGGMQEDVTEREPQRNNYPEN